MLRKRLELLIDRPYLNRQLWDAARGNDIEKLHNLLKNKGADVNYQDMWFKDTPLHTAAFYGNLEAVKLLLQRNANRNIQNKIENTPLHVAMKRRYLNIVYTLLKYGADSTLKDKQGYSADKYLQSLMTHQGESPAQPLIKTDTDKKKRKTLLIIHNMFLSARLEQLLENNNAFALEKNKEKDQTIVLKKEVLPSTRNS
jgi:hypothetical protein